MTRDLLLTEERPARRGFLRSLAIAATGAAATHRLILPATTLVTLADASARLQHHLDGLQQAFADLYPDGELKIRSGVHSEGMDDRIKSFVRGEDPSGGLRLKMTGTEGAVAGVARLSRRQDEAAPTSRPADPGSRKEAPRQCNDTARLRKPCRCISPLLGEVRPPQPSPKAIGEGARKEIETGILV